MSLIFSMRPPRPAATFSWQRRATAPAIPGVLHKETRAPRGRAGLVVDFSTATVDRMCDTVNQAGWELDNYRRNPVLLYGHDYKALPIGRVPDIHVAGNLRGTPEFAPPGVSAFADEARRLYEAGYLSAFSVGFKPVETRPNAYGGTEYVRQELLEISLVPIPANQEAVAARTLRDHEPVASRAREQRWLGLADDPGETAPSPARWRSGVWLGSTDAGARALAEQLRGGKR